MPTENSPAEVSPEVLAVIVCPHDHASLLYDREHTHLRCSVCTRVFKIENGVPNLIPKE